MKMIEDYENVPLIQFADEDEEITGDMENENIDVN